MKLYNQRFHFDLPIVMQIIDERRFAYIFVATSKNETFYLYKSVIHLLRTPHEPSS